MKLTTIFICALALWLPSRLIAQQQPITVKFKIASTGHQLVQVNVNGKGPYWMVFDTGAYHTSISPELNAGENVTLDIGGAKGNINVAAREHSVLKGLKQLHADLAQVQGLIGHNFFAPFRMTIDYQQQEMTFKPNGYDPGDVQDKLVTRAMGGKIPKKTPPRRVLFGLSVEDPVANARGAYVKAVFSDSAAQVAGLRKGDYIVGINEWWIDDAEDFSRCVATLTTKTVAKVFVLREGRVMTVELKPRIGF